MHPANYYAYGYRRMWKGSVDPTQKMGQTPLAASAVSTVAAERFEAVMHEPRAGHRLDYRPDGPLVTADATRQPHEPVGVGGDANAPMTSRPRQHT